MWVSFATHVGLFCHLIGPLWTAEEGSERGLGLFVCVCICVGVSVSLGVRLYLRQCVYISVRVFLFLSSGVLPQNMFSYYRMCSLTRECVLLL